MVTFLCIKPSLILSSWSQLIQTKHFYLHKLAEIMENAMVNNARRLPPELTIY